MRPARAILLTSLSARAAASGQAPAPKLFAPAVISTERYESHPALSRDGRLLLFVRSDPSFSQWKIWQSSRTRSGWLEPMLASFAISEIAADPYFAPDARHVYFISRRLAPGKAKHDLDIWVVERQGSGWGASERLPEPINSPSAEWFPRLQPDGSLYFGSNRPGGHGGTDIYRARQTATGWQVTNLGPPVNSAADEYEFELTPNGRIALLMADRDPNSGGDIYLVRHTSRGWSAPKRLGPEINTSQLEVGPLISRDGKHFYFSSRRNDERLGDIYRARMPRASE